MRIYLDNCCYNRPYDDQTNIMVRLEAEAKLYIQELIREGNIELVWSSVNDYENNDNPSPEKSERIKIWKNIAVENCLLNEDILRKSFDLVNLQLKPKDALHVASAIFSNCEYFITTDKKILNKNIRNINAVNPITFMEIYSNEK